MSNWKVKPEDHPLILLDYKNQTIADFVKLYKNALGGKGYLYKGQEHTNLFFHSNWEWMMPVINAIEELNYDTAIMRKDGKYIFRVRKKDSDELFINIEGPDKLNVVFDGIYYFCKNNPEEKPKLKLL